MRLDVEALVGEFGRALDSPELGEKLAALGFAATVARKALRATGTQHIADESRGIVLMFLDRAGYEAQYGAPLTAGEAIFAAVAVYPTGFREFASYQGRIGHSLDGVTDREALHAVLGAGVVRDEDDGVVYEESWPLGAANLFANYRDDTRITSLQFNVHPVDAGGKAATLDSSVLIAHLGEATESPALRDLLGRYGRSPSELSVKEIRSQGSASMAFTDERIELVFRERKAFERKYAPAEGHGIAVLASVVVYPHGKGGDAPLLGGVSGIGGIVVGDRDSAYRLLGPPARTEFDGPIVRWEQWDHPQLQVRATYDDAGRIRKLSASVPMQR